MKRFFTLLLLFFSGISYAQKNADSLFLELDTIEANAEKFEFLLEKMDVNFVLKPEIAHLYWKKFSSLAEELGTKKRIAQSLWWSALINKNLEKLDTAVLNYLEAIKLYRELNSEEFTADLINNIGEIFMEVNDYEKANQYFYDAIEIYQRIDATHGLANTYRNLSKGLAKIEKYDQALKYVFKALQLAAQLDDQYLTNGIQNVAGMVYYFQKNYSKAREHYLKATKRFGEEENKKLRLGMAYNNIGQTYMEEGNFAEAREYFQRALEQKRKYGDPPLTAGTLLNLGILDIKEGNSEKAIQPLKEAISLMDISVYSNNLNEGLELLIKIYKEKKHPTDQDYQYLLELNEMYHEQVKLLAAEKKKSKLNIVIKEAIAKEEAEYLANKATGLQKRTVWIIAGSLLIFVALIIFYARRETRIRKAITDMWKDLKDV